MEVLGPHTIIFYIVIKVVTQPLLKTKYSFPSITMSAKEEKWISWLAIILSIIGILAVIMLILNRFGVFTE